MQRVEVIGAVTMEVVPSEKVRWSIYSETLPEQCVTNGGKLRNTRSREHCGASGERLREL